MYELIGRIAVYSAGGLVLWTLVGFCMLAVYAQWLFRINGCWGCFHGDVRDRIALWFARRLYLRGQGFRTYIAAPVLVPIGVVTVLRDGLDGSKREARHAIARTT